MNSLQEHQQPINFAISNSNISQSLPNENNNNQIQQLKLAAQTTTTTTTTTTTSLDDDDNNKQNDTLLTNHHHTDIVANNKINNTLDIDVDQIDNPTTTNDDGDDDDDDDTIKCTPKLIDQLDLNKSTESLTTTTTTTTTLTTTVEQQRQQTTTTTTHFNNNTTAVEQLQAHLPRGSISSRGHGKKSQIVIRKFQKLDQSALSSGPAPDVKIGQRVAYKEYYGNEFGTIRWIGRVPQICPDWTVGVEFDNAIGEGDGSLNGRRYFISKDCFAKFLPLFSVALVDQHVGRPEPGTMISVMSAAVRPGQMISIQRVSTVHVQHCFLNAPHRKPGADFLAVNTRLHCQCPNCGPCAHVIKPPRTQRLTGSRKNATHMCQFSTYTCCGMESQEEAMCTYSGNKISSLPPPIHSSSTNLPPIGNSWFEGAGYLTNLQAQQSKLMPEEYRFGALPEDADGTVARRRLSRSSSSRRESGRRHHHHSKHSSHKHRTPSPSPSPCQQQQQQQQQQPVDSSANLNNNNNDNNNNNNNAQNEPTRYSPETPPGNKDDEFNPLAVVCHPDKDQYDDDYGTEQNNWFGNGSETNGGTKNIEQQQQQQQQHQKSAKFVYRDSIENRYLFPTDEPIDSMLEADLENLSQARYGHTNTNLRLNGSHTRNIFKSLRSLVSCLSAQSNTHTHSEALERRSENTFRFSEHATKGANNNKSMPTIAASYANSTTTMTATAIATNNNNNNKQKHLNDYYDNDDDDDDCYSTNSYSPIELEKLSSSNHYYYNDDNNNNNNFKPQTHKHKNHQNHQNHSSSVPLVPGIVNGVDVSKSSIMDNNNNNHHHHRHHHHHHHHHHQGRNQQRSSDQTNQTTTTTTTTANNNNRRHISSSSDCGFSSASQNSINFQSSSYPTCSPVLSAHTNMPSDEETMRTNQIYKRIATRLMNTTNVSQEDLLRLRRSLFEPTTTQQQQHFENCCLHQTITSGNCHQQQQHMATFNTITTQAVEPPDQIIADIIQKSYLRNNNSGAGSGSGSEQKGEIQLQQQRAALSACCHSTLATSATKTINHCHNVETDRSSFDPSFEKKLSELSTLSSYDSICEQTEGATNKRRDQNQKGSKQPQQTIDLTGGDNKATTIDNNINLPKAFELKLTLSINNSDKSNKSGNTNDGKILEDEDGFDGDSHSRCSSATREETIGSSNKLMNSTLNINIVSSPRLEDGQSSSSSDRAIKKSRNSEGTPTGIKSPPRSASANNFVDDDHEANDTNSER